MRKEPTVYECKGMVTFYQPDSTHDGMYVVMHDKHGVKMAERQFTKEATRMLWWVILMLLK